MNAAVIAERLETAYERIENPSGEGSSYNPLSDSVLLICVEIKLFTIEFPFETIHSEKRLPCQCGIRRIWVHPEHRRKGLGTRLLDAVR